MLPFPLDEKKPGLYPGEFRMKAVSKLGEIELLVIERCMHPVYLDETRPRLIVPDPSDLVATSLVQDFKQSIHGFIPDVAEPGIDFVWGEFPNTRQGKELLAAQHADVLRGMARKQEQWFLTLVRLADDDWSKHHSHRMVTDLQRMAAMTLGLKNKDWLLETQVETQQNRCRWCFAMVDPRAAVCGSCKGPGPDERLYVEYVRSQERMQQGSKVAAPIAPQQASQQSAPSSTPPAK